MKLLEYQAKEVLASLGIPIPPGVVLGQLVYDTCLGEHARPLIALIKKLHRAIPDYDALTAEINPLVITRSGEVVAGDAKLEIDDNSAWRHKDLEQKYGSVIE